MAYFTRRNRRLLLALLTIFILPKASSLRCKACKSTQSWEHCKGNMNETECAQTDARCVKFDYAKTDSTSNKKQIMFGLGCAPQSQCSSSLFLECKNLQNSGDDIKATCNVRCCGEDLCNSQVKLNCSVLYLMVAFLAHVIFVKVLL